MNNRAASGGTSERGLNKKSDILFYLGRRYSFLLRRFFYFLFYRFKRFFVLFELQPRVIESNSEFFSFKRQTRAGFRDNAVFNSGIQNIRLIRNTLTVHNIEFSNPERRSNFVFYDFRFRPVPYHLLAFFHLRDAAHVYAHRTVKLQSHPARSRFRIAEHYPYFHP